MQCAKKSFAFTNGQHFKLSRKPKGPKDALTANVWNRLRANPGMVCTIEGTLIRREFATQYGKSISPGRNASSLTRPVIHHHRPYTAMKYKVVGCSRPSNPPVEPGSSCSEIKKQADQLVEKFRSGAQVRCNADRDCAPLYGPNGCGVFAKPSATNRLNADLGATVRLFEATMRKYSAKSQECNFPVCGLMPYKMKCVKSDKSFFSKVGICKPEFGFRR
jgi:hypothetical protein